MVVDLKVQGGRVHLRVREQRGDEVVPGTAGPIKEDSAVIPAVEQLRETELQVGTIIVNAATEPRLPTVSVHQAAEGRLDRKQLAAELAAAGIVVEPGPAADVSACAGRPGCAKALADVRTDALAAIGHLPAGRVHVSGCARRCGAPRGQHVDAVALAGGGYVVDGIARAGLR